MSPFRKKHKPTTINGSSIRFDEISNSYRNGSNFVYFGEGSSRIYDVPDAFLRRDVTFEVLSQVNRIITLGNPKSLSGKSSEKGLRLSWTLSRFDKKFAKQCSDEEKERILHKLGAKSDSECLRGISYRNEFQDRVTIHLDGDSLQEICSIFGTQPRPLYRRAADILNKKYKGHRSNGDSVIKVSSIHPEDMEVFKLLMKERIIRAQRLDDQEFIITNEVDDAEEVLVRNLHELSRKFDVPEVIIENTASPDDKEVLISEQLDACKISMNNPVSFLSGMPGTGKTSTLCRILKESRGTVVLTPSHVSREVVRQRAIQNGVDTSTFSTEVLAFATRHVREWIPPYMASREQIISQRSRDFMERFKGEDGVLQVDTLVIEEASMCDLFQISDIIDQFCSIDSLKRIVFCGDVRQLQSVSKGRVLQDIIECGSIPGKILQVNHRSGFALSDNLRHILDSSMINMEEDESFQVLLYPLNQCEIDTDSYGRERVMALQPIIDTYRKNVEKGLPSHVFGYMHVEINAINDALKTSLFGDKTVMFPDGCKVRVKDPDVIVPSCFHRNDFIEIVQNFGPKRFLVKRWGGENCENDLVEIKVSGKLREALTLGYASSIHAFQGSECPHVIIHGIPNCAYFNRDALYTACSRGKKKAIVVTCSQDRKNWKKIVYKRAVPRLSNLSRRL